MRWLFWILVSVLVAIGISLFAGIDNGYVLIVRPPYRLELSFNLLLILIVLSFFSLHYALRFYRYARKLPATVKHYREQQRQTQGQAALLDALHYLIDGQYQLAEKLAARALQFDYSIGLSALVAARAAHRLQRKQQRDYYLAEAERRSPETATQRLFTQADLQVDEKNYTDALESLQSLAKLDAHHAPALRLSLHVYKALQHWDELLHTLKTLEKQGALDSEKLNDYRTEAHLNKIETLGQQETALQTYWQTLSEAEKRNPRLTHAMALALQKADAHAHAIQLLQHSLNNQWNPELVTLLGDCQAPDPSALYQSCETWLLSHQGDPALLYTLGKLATQAQQYDKALTFLSTSLTLQHSQATRRAIGEVYEALKQPEQALTFYK